MQILVEVEGTRLIALVDSGSTHNFISEEAASRTRVPVTKRASMRVAVANGDHVFSNGVCRNMAFVCAQERFLITCYTLALGGFDVVLGIQWLRSLGPIFWDFSRLAMSFWRHDHLVILYGEASPPSRPGLASCTQELMPSLLQEFSNLFNEPSNLPPVRPCDHRIHLFPGSGPVVVRPYRYPTVQKDEIERQCTDMLERGLIRKSKSEFSSPVLLVKKPDISWHFCIDYRTLNEKTVKDKFPIDTSQTYL
jgi:hypothetical protein